MLFRQKGTGTAQHLTTPNLRDLWQGRVIAVGIQVLNAGQIQTLLDRRHRSAYVCWLTWTVAAWSFNMAIKQNVHIHGFFSCQTAFRCFYAVLNPHWSCACVWIVHNGGCGGVQFRICTKKNHSSTRLVRKFSETFILIFSFLCIYCIFIFICMQHNNAIQYVFICKMTTFSVINWQLQHCDRGSRETRINSI